MGNIFKMKDGKIDLVGQNLLWQKATSVPQQEGQKQFFLLLTCQIKQVKKIITGDGDDDDVVVCKHKRILSVCIINIKILRATSKLKRRDVFSDKICSHYCQPVVHYGCQICSKTPNNKLL